MSMDFPLKIDSAPSLTQVFTPVNVAILTSVGLHAFILGLALPSLQWSQPDQAPKKGQVNVIQLTDAEQSRLPETSPFSNSSAFLPNTSSELPSNIPDLSSNNPSLNLPTTSPPLPSTDYNYNSLPSQIPLPPSLPNLPGYPSNLPPLSNYGYGSLSRVARETPPISLPPLPSFPMPSYRRSSERPSLPGMNNLPSGNSNLPNLPRPQFGEQQPLRGTDFITRASQGNGNPVSTASPNEPELQAQGEDTPSMQALQNDLKWRASLGSQKSSDIEAITLYGSYPRIACRNRTEATVVYNVDPNGSITPVSLSRYPIFNELAQQAFQSQRFTRPTRVRVNFNYDPKVCGSMATAAPPLLNNPSNNNPAIAPNPSLPSNSTVNPLNSAYRRGPELPTLPRSGGTVPNSSTVPEPSQTPVLSPPSENRNPGSRTPDSNPNPTNSNSSSPSLPPASPETATPTQPEIPPSPAIMPPKPAAVAPTIPPVELKPSVTPKPESTATPSENRSQPETKRSRLFNNNNRPTVRLSPRSSVNTTPDTTPAEVKPTPEITKPTDGSTESSSLAAPAVGKK